ncbi:MAG TPA: hypothetical protein VJM12_03385 [Pyrinomonadaceae bacterium]|nr:hypothetical protein [Pyrinomonadaceae bacterium]
MATSSASAAARPQANNRIEVYIDYVEFEYSTSMGPDVEGSKLIKDGFALKKSFSFTPGFSLVLCSGAFFRNRFNGFRATRRANR